LASVVRRPSSVALAAGGLVLLLGIILASTMRHGTPESKIGDLKSEIRNPKSEIAPLAVAPFDEKKAKEHQEGWSKHLGVPVEMTNSIGMKLVLIPPGEFMMGSPKELIEDELKTHGDEPWYKDHLPGEGPRHRVRITRPFYLGMYEVTQGEYERVIGKNPSKFSATGKGKDKVAGQDTKRFPVEQVSWEEAAEFCRKLSDLPEEKAAGRTYRLPSEAQWEYACRAGTAGRYSFSLGRSGLSREHEEKALSDYGWFGSNAGDMPHAVGERKPNAWGLYDMHGNVWELCHDWYDRDYYAISPLDDPGGPPAGSCRVDRGGSWTDPAWHCRSACRDLYLPELGHDNLGFRASLVLPDTVAERAKMGPSNDAAQPPGGSTANKPSPAPPAPNPQSPIPPPAVGGLVGADGKWQLPPGAPFPAVAPFDAAKAKEHQEGWAKHLRVPVEITNSIGMKLVLIPPGEFQMGSPKELIEEEMRLYGGDGWYRDLLPGEGPQHRVRITRPYWLGVTAVTQEEYQRVMGSNPSKFPGDPKRPVEQVSWGEAVEFCRRLSELPGEKAAKQRYGLPTEAQWEYACRAGSTGRWCFSTQRNPLPRVVEGEILGEYGWFNANTDVPTHPVAQKQANAWGLHDMYGNVWEWCEDWYDRDFYAKSAIDDPTGASGGARRVLRGGGWRYPAGICRSASRDCFEPGNRDGHLGFRAALVLADK
jgi:formylglycine-generating enzyme required for sulfatase activity